MNKEFFEKYSIVAYPREIIFYDKNEKGGKVSYYVDRKISDYISFLQEKIDKLKAQQGELEIETEFKIEDK